MNYRRLVSSGSWLVRNLCTVARNAAGKSKSAAVDAASKRENRLYVRLSRLPKTGGTVSEVLNGFIDEGRRVTKEELTHIVKELRKYHRYQHALDIMDWMGMQNVQYNHKDHAIRIDLIAKAKGIEEAENYFNSLPPIAKTQSTYGSLFSCYCIAFKKDEAQAFFEKMDDLKFVNNDLPLSNLMSMFMKLGQPEKVPELIDEMKRRNIPPSSFNYVVWMQSYASMNDLEGVERVREELARDSPDKITPRTYNNLAAIYVKFGEFEKAEECLKKLEEDKRPRDRQAYHYLISLYAHTSNLAEVKRVWASLKQFFPTVTNMSYLTMIHALIKLKDFKGLKECYEEWESSCSSYDMRLATSTVRGFLSADMLEQAEGVLDDAMKKRRELSSKAMEPFMVYFLNKCQFDSALKHLEAAISVDKTWQPMPGTKIAFFDYFMKEGDVDAAEEFCKLLKSRDCLDANAYLLLLKTYAAAGKQAPDMRQRLEKDAIELSQELQDLLENVCPE
ncbi:hypothetical protein COLO4_23216 [Corchorus olitorius]|uniref:Tetratricopeptide-like helical n=1 Tax=Corchorus olitorius TaxID=93759 RepID=A0A1R3IHQ2_9ROSI|nr:hypothetical protein COLO4_23216 [Corchorus olitorius]